MKKLAFLFLLSLPAFAQPTDRWLDLGSGTLFSNASFPDTSGGPALTSLDFGFTSLAPGKLYDWNGGFYDLRSSRFCVGTGGHAGYLGNELTCQDTRTHTVYPLYHYSPFNYSGSGSVPCAGDPTTETTCDGLLSSRHTYNGQTVAQDIQTMFSFGGGLPSSTNSVATWALDLAWQSNATITCAGTPGNNVIAYEVACVDSNNETWVCHNTAGCTVAADMAQIWTRKTNQPGPCNDVQTAWYEAGQKIFWICNGNYLYSYAYPTDTWSGSLNGGLTLGYNTIMVPDQSRGIMIIVGNGNLGYFWMDGRDSYTYHDQTGVISGSCSGLISGIAPGAEMDPNDNNLVGMFPGALDAGTGLFVPGDNTIYVINPTSWTCTSSLVSGGPGAIASTNHGLWSRFRYSPSERGFITQVDYAQDAFVYQRAVDTPVGLGHSAVTSSGPCLDLDGDGYGVGAGCLGPDGDDFDATVHTAAQIITKYGSMNAFLVSKGIQHPTGSGPGQGPAYVFCVDAVHGNDSTGAKNVNADTACGSTPYQTFNGTISALAAPYIILYRAGTYTEHMDGMVGGVPTFQTVIMGYPGESATIDYSASVGDVVGTVDYPYITVSNLTLKGNASGPGYITGTYATYGGGGATSILSKHNALLFCEISGGGSDSNVNGDNESDVTIQYNVVHDPAVSQQHNIYLASNTLADYNVTISNNITYNVFTGGYPSIQLNGRCTGCFIEGNWVYNTDAGQITLFNGVQNSFTRGNLTWNTGDSDGGARSPTTHSFFLDTYSSGQCRISGQPSICAWDMNGNVIENNTFWQGLNEVTSGAPDVNGIPFEVGNGTFTSADCGGSTVAPCGDTGHNYYRNNTVVSTSGAYPLVSYAASTGTGAQILALDTWTNNIFNTQSGTNPYIIDGTQKTCSQVSSLALSSTGCSTTAASFANVSNSYWNAPQTFNFNPANGSPMIGDGSPAAIPAVDTAGNLFNRVTPNIGFSALAPSCAIVPANPGPWTIGQFPGTTFMTAGCGSGPFTWMSSGWPTGINNSACNSTSTCVLGGSPTTAGTSTATISVTDGGSNSATITPSILVNLAPVITSPTSSLPSGTQGTAYSQPITVNPVGTLPTVCSLSSGTLPAGLSVSTTCGTGLAGTPTVSGTFTNLRFTATDANNITSTVGPFTLIVNPSGGTSITPVSVIGNGVSGVRVGHNER